MCTIPFWLLQDTRHNTAKTCRKPAFKVHLPCKTWVRFTNIIARKETQVCKTTLICVQLVPPLPACTVCGLHRTRLSRVDLYEAKSEYYVYCLACGQCSWFMFDLYYPAAQIEDRPIWLRRLIGYDAEVRKQWTP